MAYLTWLIFQIVVKFRIEHWNIAVLLCAKSQYDLTTEMDDVGEE